MRILMISKACIIAPYRAKLEELSRLPGVELHALVPPRWGGQELEPGHQAGYELIVAPMRFNGHFHLHFYPSLRRHMRRIRPHIVHMDEEPYNLATWQALAGAKGVGAKALFFTWQNLLRRYPLPFRALERRNYRLADYALAGNAEAAQVLRAKGYAGPLAVIPQFGIDPELYAPAEPGLTGERPYTVGYAGRLVPEKGVDLLLRAAAGLEGPWQLRILGQGPEEARLRAVAGEMGIPGRVAFSGAAPADLVPGFLRGLDVLVLPSRSQANWKEQFGRILIEAMSCQVPVVGSSSGEIPHVIGQGGLVFPEGDVDALRRRLVQVRDAPDRRARWGIPGRQRVLDHYTQARIAARTYEVYQELVEGVP